MQLLGELSLRITCKRKHRKNNPPPPKATGDNPADLYEECGGVYEVAVAELASQKIITCHKCKGEFSNGMKAIFSGDRVAALAQAINEAASQASRANAMYVAEIFAGLPAKGEA